MRFFLDTEFNQNGCFVQLISIGIVAEDGREYYAQNQERFVEMDQPFVVDHVLPLFVETAWKPVRQIREEVTAFIDPSKGPHEIWAWYGNYDWVAFCGTIYGNMVNVPDGMPWNVMDLKQYSDYLNLGDLRLASPEGEHNALVDARWNRDYYDFLYRIDQAQRDSTKKTYCVERALKVGVPYDEINKIIG